MNSLGSWIDRAELDRLVAVVGPTPKSPSNSSEAPAPKQNNPLPWKRSAEPTDQPPKASDPPLESSAVPERFPVAEEVEKFRVKVAAIKDKARSLGVLSPGSQDAQSKDYVPPTRTPRVKAHSAKNPEKTNPSEFRVPQGPLRLRLESFGEWAVTLTHAQAVVVADSQGDLVFERGASGDWVSSVTMVASAGERAGRHLSISGNTLIHIDLPADRKLAILPCQTKFGHLSVGLVVPKALNPSQARSIAHAITAVIARQ